MADTLIPLCGLYENVSRKTGKTYFVGNLSFTSRLLIFRNEDAQEGEPPWSVFITERSSKPPSGQTGDPPLPSKGKPLRGAEQPVPGDYGGIDGGDYPIRTKRGR